MMKWLALILVLLTGCTLQTTTIQDEEDPNMTASQLTPMVSGQQSFGNSLNRTGLEAGTYTLQFGIRDITQAPLLPSQPPSIPTVQAIINWKIDGQQQRRVISVVSGASISGVCEAVDVSIVDKTSNPTLAGFTYNVQVTLSKGMRGNVQQPPALLDSLATLVPNAGLLVHLVPPDSGVISVFLLIDAGVPAIASDFQLVMTDPSGGVVYAASTPATLGQWIPLVPGTAALQVFNHSATPALVTLLWGIEG